MTIHIMLDLETWGTTPGSDLRSIGACVFDPVQGVVCDNAGIYGVNYDPGGITDGSFYIATDNPVRPDARPQFANPNDCYADRKYPLTRDPATVQWWSEQSEEAQTAFADPVDLRDALLSFTAWLEKKIWHYPNGFGKGEADHKALRLWSHGPAFDPPILAAAYDAVGLPVPWHHRAPRDTRTCFDMAGIGDHSAWLNQHPGPLAIPHHALDDAICQARAVCAAYARQRPVAVLNYGQSLFEGNAWPVIPGSDADS